MSDETYNGWTNRETWAVALHINNDEGWQESVHSDLRGRLETIADANHEGADYVPLADYEAGEIVRDNVEVLLDPDQYRDTFGDQQPESIARISHEIGSLWRVNWTELGASFLEDIAED